MGLFPFFIAAYNGHNAAGAILDTPYNILSKDAFFYSSDARKTFDGSKDPVRKQIVKDAPLYRKPPAKKDENGGNAADKSSNKTSK